MADQHQFVVGQAAHGLGQHQLVFAHFNVADVENELAGQAEVFPEQAGRGPFRKYRIHAVVDRGKPVASNVQHPGQGVALHLRVGDDAVGQRELAADLVHRVEVARFFRDPQAGADHQRHTQALDEIAQVDRATHTGKEVHQIVIQKPRVPRIHQLDIHTQGWQVLLVGQQLDLSTARRVKGHGVGCKKYVHVLKAGATGSEHSGADPQQAPGKIRASPVLRAALQ
ncbi:hypothetical protein FQZ97_815250 [compost metagenome]